MIYITGDCHSNVIERWSKRATGITFQPEDYKIILGDFGVVWNDDYKKNTLYILNWMNTMSQGKWLAIQGNHDNWDWALSLPIVETEIGPVRQCIYEDQTFENIYIIADNCVLNIDGKKCLCMPGAESHDDPDIYFGTDGYWHSRLAILHPEDGQYYHVDGEPIESSHLELVQHHKACKRTLGKSWWAQEAVDVDDAKILVQGILDRDEYIDYVFTHDAPGIVLDIMNKRLPNGYKEIKTQGELFFDDVRTSLDFGHWYHGHLHMDNYTIEEDNRVTCLYGSLIELE